MADDLFANGISADTGRPLPPPSADTGKLIAALGIKSEEKTPAAHRAKGPMDFGLSVGLNPDDLSQAGWSILFPAQMDTSAVEQALAPLIELRRAQADSLNKLFKIFKGPAGWRTGESATEWLVRQGNQGLPGPGLDVVRPKAGVPYYLMLIGSPEELPMSLQYTLDIFWAVGRLFFPTIEEYARYAKSVVDYETAEKPPQTRKQAALFATNHPFDAATKMFTTDVALPTVNGTYVDDPLGKNQGFSLDAMLGSNATKGTLADLLRGKRANGSPALLFTGTHGMAFRADDQRLPTCQGALVCQDWGGYGAIDETSWFGAVDIPPDAQVHGLIHFMFACYGGGWEKFDTFRTGPDGSASQIAPSASVARLPQALLAHQNGGALAVIAHIDRAWSYSFRTAEGAQGSGMRDALDGILLGLRVGHAMDTFNVRWAAVSTRIADALRDFKDGTISGDDLARLWIIRDDARNYTILGDPAVRLRVGDMLNAS